MVDTVNSWTREEVLSSLQPLLESAPFASSQQLRAFLTYVVTQKLDGKEDRLKAYTIAVDALNKPETFDSQTDPTVRVLAGKLRKALNTYYADGRADALIKFLVPKGSYRPEFLSNLPAPPATQANHLDAATQYGETDIRRWWAIPALVGGVAIVAAVAFRLSSIEPINDDHLPHPPIIAVATFENISGNRDLKGFNSSLRFDLVSELSRFSWLSTYAEKEGGSTPKNPSFHADYILRGSLTVGNERIRVSYRLESAETGIVQWAQVFDRGFTSQGVLQIQKEAVRAIAIELGSPGGILNQLEQNRYQQNVGGMNAYLCTLKLYDYLKTFSVDEHLEIRDCLETAVETDPNYAEAHAALSFMYLYEELLNSNRRTGYVPLIRALEVATKAVKLDQFSTLSKRALYTALLFNGNIPEFVRIGRSAIKLNPNDPELLSDFGKKLAIDAGLWGEGMRYSKKALLLNANPTSSYFVAFALKAISEKKYAEALGWSERMQEKTWPLYNIVTAIAHAQLKNLPETQTKLKALNMNSLGKAAEIIRGYRMFKPLETLLIQELQAAFKYATSTS
ncbi:MAG: hypothetical protein JKX91_04450 [Rhizobiaceae bacterium]|nr:hypothetical protein [Rhizobiaceae bacterium]